MKNEVLLASAARGFITRSAKELGASFPVFGFGAAVGAAVGALVPVGAGALVDVGRIDVGRFVAVGLTVGFGAATGVSAIKRSAAKPADGVGAVSVDKASHGITTR